MTVFHFSFLFIVPLLFVIFSLSFPNRNFLVLFMLVASGYLSLQLFYLFCGFALNDALGYFFAWVILGIDTCELVLGLAILLNSFDKRRSISVNYFHLLKG